MSTRATNGLPTMKAAALSTQPATRTGPQPPAAPQGAPSRPSKR